MSPFKTPASSSLEEGFLRKSLCFALADMGIDPEAHPVVVNRMHTQLCYMAARNPKYFVPHKMLAFRKKAQTLVGSLADDGLDFMSFRKAELAQPTLFFMSPQTIEKNMRASAALFKEEGFVLADYIDACKRQPSLFYYTRSTLSQHWRKLKQIHREGKIELLKDPAFPNQTPTQNFIRFLFRNPTFLCLGHQNLELRRTYGSILKKMRAAADETTKPKRINVLYKSTQHIEREIITFYGHPEADPLIHPWERQLCKLADRGLLKTFRKATY